MRSVGRLARCVFEYGAMMVRSRTAKSRAGTWLMMCGVPSSGTVMAAVMAMVMVVMVRCRTPSSGAGVKVVLIAGSPIYTAFGAGRGVTCVITSWMRYISAPVQNTTIDLARSWVCSSAYSRLVFTIDVTRRMS